MRWSSVDKQNEYKEWRSWFAWYPVRIGCNYVWLEVIERKLFAYRSGDDYEYRSKGNE